MSPHGQQSGDGKGTLAALRRILGGGIDFELGVGY